MNYSELYSEYWSRADRFGESSFPNAAHLAQRIIRLTGGTRVLDVGSGIGELVRAFLAMGIDAQGVDVAESAVAHSESMTPDRFSVGSILNLPFEDDSFDVVVCTDCLQHLAPQDVPRALTELHRVCSKSVYLNIATRPDRDSRWHLTVESKSWWESQLFDSGFRRSPSYLDATSYAAQNRNTDEFNFIGSKIDQSVLLKYPGKVLLENRELHMDMTRETGSRSDAHLARYFWASHYIQRGDRVLDAACGLGYGAWMLANNSEAHSIIGIDGSEYAVDYATTSFSGDQQSGLPEFQTGRLPERLKDYPDASFDLIVSFETVEHLEDPQTFLAECARLLTPGGRFLASVPNDWTDETGEDPNPHHLHVFDWEKLAALVEDHLLVDIGATQTADRAKCDGKWVPQGRSLTEFYPSDFPSAGLAEWYLVVGVKSLEGGDAVPFTDRRSGSWDTRQRPNPIAFESMYENPWLSRVILSAGNRFKDIDNQVAEGNRLLNHGSNASDRAAGLVIVAYRLLEKRSYDHADIVQLISRVDDWLGDKESESSSEDPIQVRWTISLQYVAALLLLKIGDLQAANSRLRAVLDCDFLSFSPVLGIKSVEACLRLYLLERKSDPTSASGFLSLGLDLANRALATDPDHTVDENGLFPPYYWWEIGRIVKLAERCSDLLFQENYSETAGRDLVKLWARVPSPPGLQVEWAKKRKQHLNTATGPDSSWLTEPPALLNGNQWCAITSQESSVKARLHPAAVDSEEPAPQLQLKLSKTPALKHLLLSAHAKNNNPANEGVRLSLEFSDPLKTVQHWDVPPAELTYKIVAVPEEASIMSVEIATNMGATNSRAREILFSIEPFSG